MEKPNYNNQGMRDLYASMIANSIYDCIDLTDEKADAMCQKVLGMDNEMVYNVICNINKLVIENHDQAYVFSNEVNEFLTINRIVYNDNGRLRLANNCDDVRMGRELKDDLVARMIFEYINS